MKIVSTEKAPQAIGPYSQAIATEELLFTSGQIPLSTAGEKIEGDNTRNHNNKRNQQLHKGREHNPLLAFSQ